MRKIVLMLLTITFTCNVMGQGIKFEHGQLEDALAKAKVENKLIFVDVYTSWCGPCKLMTKNVFPKSEVGQFYNKHFVNYKLDAEDASVKGPDFAKKYDVNAYPTYLFLDAKGKLLYTSGGAMSAEMFIKIGQKAIGDEMKDNFDELVSKFRNGDHSDVILYSVLSKSKEKQALSSNDEERNQLMKIGNEVSDLYFADKPEKFLNKKDFKLLGESYQQKGILRGHFIIEYIVENYDQFKLQIKEEDLGQFLMYVNYSSIQDEAYKGNRGKYESYLKDITGSLKSAYAFNDESKIPALKFLTAMGNMEYAIGQKKYDPFLIEYKKYLSYLDDLGAIEYLMPARRILNMGKGNPTIAQLKKCVPFNQIAYDKYKNAYVCTDFGLLMAKLGDKEKAIAYYKEAFELFASQGERGERAITRYKEEMVELGL